MLCPSCGTENSEPDSRFCGHCGGRMGTSQARVAPTVKIAEGTAFPPTGMAPAAPPQAQVSRPQPAPVPLFPPVAPAEQLAGMPRTPSQAPVGGMPRAVSQPPVSIPPRNASQPPVSLPPRNASQPPIGQGSQPPIPATAPERPSAKRVAGPTPAAVTPTPTPAPGGRRWGLIIALLVIDLGLAGAGTLLLLRGLALSSAASTSQAKGP